MQTRLNLAVELKQLLNSSSGFQNKICICQKKEKKVEK